MLTRKINLHDRISRRPHVSNYINTLSETCLQTVEVIDVYDKLIATFADPKLGIATSSITDKGSETITANYLRF